MNASRLLIFSLFTLLLPALSLDASEGGQWDSPAMGKPLLAAPINATWAANHGTSWYEKGFRGFVFEGILDDLKPFPAEEEALSLAAIPFDEENTGYIETMTHPDILREAVMPGDWDGLKEEILGASNRLRAEGITENFLAMKLAPEAPWFTSPLWRRIAESRFDLASRFCRDTRLRGIALDSCSDSLFYDYRWDGWPPHMSAETLTEETRRFGRRLALVFTRHCPEGIILLRADSPESCGPLWFVFFDALLEGLQSSRGGALRLLFSGLTDSDRPQNYQASREKVERLWEARLSGRAQQGWQRKGGLVFSLEPVDWIGDMPVARQAVEQYIPALYETALQGLDYIIIDAPTGGWWHIPPDVAEQFSGLYQKGRGRVRFAPPIPRSLDAFQPRLLYESAQLLGDLIIGEMACTVLHHEGKTVLFARDGIPESMGWPLNTGIMTVTEAMSGEKRYHGPREGRVTLPAMTVPVFIEGSPLEEYALPASFDLKIEPPLSSGVTRSRMTVSLANMLTTPLEGMVTLSTSSRYALGSSAVAVYINPGERLSFTRHLQGLSFQGANPSFVMTFNRPNAVPVAREFYFSAAPRERDCLFVDGPLTGVPAWLPGQAGNPENSLVWCDRRGRLMAYGLEKGESLWSSRFRGSYSQPPVLLKNRRSEWLIALANDHNRIRLLDRAGMEKALLLPEGSHITELAVVEQDKQGDILAVLLDEESLIFYEGGLRFLGRKKGAGKIHHLTTHPLFPETLLCITETEESDKTSYHLTCLDGTGESLWSQDIPDAPTAAPLIRALAESDDPEIFLPDRRGVIHVFSGKDAGEHSSFKLDGMKQIERSSFLTLHEKEILLCQSGNTVAAYGPEEDGTAILLWQLEISGLTALVTQPEGAGIIAGTADGGLQAFSAAGDYMWEDRRGTGAITHLDTLPSPALQSYRLFVASQDACIRILEVQAEK
ncbi:MAG: PQQ-binding-like beta-propeller repeat protein [Candidatus Hydrogenedens sp.]|nr:PQQ-binding-like beta-propeller repeat protein [Candidatus Hydrogenedens sp.]